MKYLLHVFIIMLLMIEPVFCSSYKLGPGDVISLKVWDESDLSGDFKVNSKGLLVINWLDPIDVTSITLEELKEKLIKLLGRKYIKNPKITAISIKEYASNKVSLMGEVDKPGNYKIDESTTILDVILRAGGPRSNASDDVIILRKFPGIAGEKSPGDIFNKKTFSLNNLMTKKEIAANIKLQNLDVIYIPSTKSITEAGSVDSGVTVIGAVEKMGVFRFREGYTAMNAIIDAGGFTKYAAMNRTLLVRGKGKEKKTYTIKMGDVMKKGHKKKDRPLKPGDIIIAREGFL